MIGTMLKADTVQDDLAKIRFNWSSDISGDEFKIQMFISTDRWTPSDDNKLT